MDPKSLETLEFPKVLALLAAEAGSGWGRELCLALQPSADFCECTRAQQETAEARLLLESGRLPSLDGLPEVREALARAGIGGVLSPAELRAVAAWAVASRRLQEAVARQGLPAGSPLAAAAAALGAFREIEDAIEQAISEEGRVLDGASPRLAALRAEGRRTEAGLRERLEAFVQSARGRQALQEPLVTLRGSRFVVPVRHDQREKVPGVVHDRSASGATLYVEPLFAVELNNHLRELAAAEEAEVEAVLRRLSGLVKAAGDELVQAVAGVARLDFILARAGLARKQDASPPVLNREGRVQLRRARHPLLGGEVVPLDVWLGGDFTTLVITGPNTGGKTVALKTVGLLTLMAQAGLQVPAAPGSELAVFEGVYADIGDEQSIEQSLSTFSSHMTNVIRILGRAGPRSLVLLDEIGAGTDPDEGAALAMALLEELLARQTRVVATTHFSELKAFAHAHPQAENASVEFDAESLRPTYRLAVGLPGRSNALEIAGRLGLPAAVLERARRRRAPRQGEVEDLLAGLARDRKEAEAARRAAAAAQAEAEELRGRYRRLVDELEGRRDELLAEARRQARELLQGARREVESLLSELRREHEAALAEKARQTHKRLVEGLEALNAQEERPPGPAGEGPDGPLDPGERVYIPSLRQEATVVRGAQGERDLVLVQAGSVRLEVPRDQLTRAAPDQAPQAAPGPPGPLASHGTGLRAAKRAQVSPEIHLRGMRVEEALDLLDKYVDDALLAGLPSVRIVHGKGTGTLRAAVREYLTAHPRVRAFRLAPPHEGGDGVTVAELEG